MYSKSLRHCFPLTFLSRHAIFPGASDTDTPWQMLSAALSGGQGFVILKIGKPLNEDWNSANGKKVMQELAKLPPLSMGERLKLITFCCSVLI